MDETPLLPIPLAYGAVVMIWSTTPLAIQWSTEGADFTFAIMLRMAIGLVVAVAMVLMGRQPFPLHREARLTYLAGGLGLFGTMICVYWSALRLHSGMLSLLFGLSPLVTSILAVLWLKERALSPIRLVAMVLALIGLAAVWGNGARIEGAALSGICSVLLAVLINAGSLVAIKRVGADVPPLAITTGMLLLSLPLFVAVWLWADGRWPVQLPLRAGLAIVYLGVVGSVLAFGLYYLLVKHLDTSQVALITVVTPILALLMGQGLNGETVGAQVWLGAAFICAGLALHHGEGWVTRPFTVR